MPSPCLAAASAPDGVVEVATEIGKRGAEYGARCSRASFRVNQSVFMVTGASQASRATMAASASSMRRRCWSAGMPIM